MMVIFCLSYYEFQHALEVIHLVTPPCDGDMQRVVAANFRVSHLTPVVERLQERHALFGDDKVQDHCSPSGYSGLVKHTHYHRDGS